MRPAVLVALFFVGCALPHSHSESHPPLSNTICWSRGLDFGIKEWRQEVNQRFGPDTVLVICHGIDNKGEWDFNPDDKKPVSVQKTVERLQQQYPHRTIVLVTCNPGAYELSDLPNVYYVRRNVLIPPFTHDPQLKAHWPDCAGTIWEFSNHP